MKNDGLITRGGNAVKYCLMIAVPFLLSGCYTVLKQSSEYYSEFDQKSVPRDTTNRKVADEMTALGDNVSDHDSTKEDEDDQRTVVNNYYGSVWGGYPYSRWGMSFGYGYSPYYSGWYDWGYYPSWDYWYWGGCYYPTGFGGYYRPYYPYYNFTPVSPYAHRNYGGRHYATQAGGIGLIGHSYGGNLTNNSGGKRTYKTGTTSTPTHSNRTATGNGRRHYRSGDHASGPTKKVRSGSSGGRTYSNNKSVTRAFENASRNQSGRSYTNSSTRSSSGSGSGRGSNQSAPRSGGGGGRSFKK